MDSIPSLLFLTSAAGIVWTLARFFHSGRYAGTGMTDASMAFHHMWLLSCVALAVGVGLLPGYHWTWGVAVGGAGCMLSVPAKSVAQSVFTRLGWQGKPDTAQREKGPFSARCGGEDRPGPVGLQTNAESDAVHRKSGGRGA